MSPDTICKEANARLADEVYAPALPKWREFAKANPGISLPMFLKAKPAYFAARPRVIFIGQETHGWWTDCPHPQAELTAEQLMDFYQDDNMNEVRLYYRSPYWRTIRQIVELAQVENYPDSILTTNIFVCDFKRGRAQDSQIESMRSWRVLPQELNILKPDAVIFFIGPIYSYNLEPYFGRHLKQRLSRQSPCVPYNPPGVSWKGWVTYHPKSLVFSGLGGVAGEIASSIAQLR